MSFWILLNEKAFFISFAQLIWGDNMKILYIYAHQEPKSFNAALKETALSVLGNEGHNVKISDLYAMKFKAVLDSEDFLNRKNPEIFKPFLEAMHASKTETFAPDIKTEMDKVKWAELLIFQFPVYFSSMPAIMKGWLDRVLAPGFAFNPITKSAYEKGLLKGKAAMLVLSTGASEEWYSKGGAHGALLELLKPITHCVFEYTGMKVLPSYVSFEVGAQSREKGAKELERYRQSLLKLEEWF